MYDKIKKLTLAVRWIWNHSLGPHVSRMECAMATDMVMKKTSDTTMSTPCACTTATAAHQ